MELLIGLLVVSNIAFAAGLYLVVVQATKNKEIYNANEETYSAFYQELEDLLRLILTTMHEIDINGSFESDDEVGSVFVQIKGLIKLLEDFKLENFPESALPDDLNEGE